MQGTAIRVLEAAFIGYPVIDVARARRFYESIFHLKPTLQFEEDGKSWIEYDLKGTTFAINNMSEEWKPAPVGPSLALEVDDFEETIKILRSEKVQFYLEPFETPVCRMCVIADTEGNSLIIHKRK